MEYYNNLFEYLVDKPFGTWAEFYELYYGLPQPVYYTVTIGSIVIGTLIALWAGNKFNKTL